MTELPELRELTEDERAVQNAYDYINESVLRIASGVVTLMAVTRGPDWVGSADGILAVWSYVKAVVIPLGVDDRLFECAIAEWSAFPEKYHHLMYSPQKEEKEKG